MYIFIHVGSPWTLPIDVDMPFNLLAHAQVAIPKSEARRHICYMNGSVSLFVLNLYAYESRTLVLGSSIVTANGVPAGFFLVNCNKKRKF